MNAELGWAGLEDQPVCAGFFVHDAGPPEHIAEERPRGRCVVGIDEGVYTGDHWLSLGLRFRERRAGARPSEPPETLTAQLRQTWRRDWMKRKRLATYAPSV